MRQAVVQVCHSVFGADRGGLAQQDRAGIKARCHLHDADAGFRITRHDRPVDRGRTTPARQKRGVDVQGAVRRCSEKDGGQDQAVSDDNGHVAAQRRKVLLHGFAAQRNGVTHGDIQTFGAGLNRAGAVRFAATGGAGGLGVDRSNFVLRRNRAQGGDREFRGAHEDDPHPRRCTFSARVSSMRRRRGERWSKYIFPTKWSIWCWTDVAHNRTKSRSSISPSAFR